MTINKEKLDNQLIALATYVDAAIQLETFRIRGTLSDIEIDYYKSRVYEEKDPFLGCLLIHLGNIRNDKEFMAAGEQPAAKDIANPPTTEHLKFEEPDAQN